jgi:thiosulfate/3-mercaptopyruvate sulfurtransferase
VEFLERHIPGAAFFDVDGIRDPNTGLSHMLPSPGSFGQTVSALGIDNGDTVIVYDAPGSAAAARVWWTFRVFGHADVAVLDGGLEKWIAEGRPVDDRPPQPREARFEARYNGALVRSVDDLLANLKTAREQVIDNRGSGRFAGREPEPRPARHLGHIPGSLNIPFTGFIDLERQGAWRSADEIAGVFRDAGVDLNQPLVSSCGSGVTACTTAFAAFLLGKEDVAVYDGSWAEWGNRDDTPVER